MVRKNHRRLVKELMSIYVEPTDAVLLRQLSDDTRVPMQAYLREGLDYVLKKYMKKQTKKA